MRVVVSVLFWGFISLLIFIVHLVRLGCDYVKLMGANLFRTIKFLDNAVYINSFFWLIWRPKNGVSVTRIHQ